MAKTRLRTWSLPPCKIIPVSDTTSSPVSDPFILCENLVKIHKVADLEVVALQGLDLRVEKGELMAIVGSSGSGKSTLMNVLGGLDRPSAGKILVNKRNLLTMSDRELDTYRRTAVGFVWQQGARNLVPYLSAVQNIELPMQLLGFSPRATKKRGLELLDTVHLAHRKDHHMVALSGGEQQRVAIAVALANSPELLLADEPTGELDGDTAAKIYEAFREINTRLGVTTIIVSHDRDIARQVRRVVGIQDGKVATETRAETGHASRVMLDSAGRLQINKLLREKYGFSKEATIEETSDGILIRPGGAN